MTLKYFWGAKHKGWVNSMSKRFIPNKWHDLFHKTPLLSLQQRGLIGRLFLCASPVIMAMLGFHRNLCADFSLEYFKAIRENRCEQIVGFQMPASCFSPNTICHPWKTFQMSVSGSARPSDAVFTLCVHRRNGVLGDFCLYLMIDAVCQVEHH